MFIDKPIYKEDYSYTYKYNNSIYNVKVIFNDSNNIILDGDLINTNFVKLRNDLKVHKVIFNIKK